MIKYCRTCEKTLHFVSQCDIFAMVIDMFYNRNRFVDFSINHSRQEAGEQIVFKMHTHATAELFYFVAGSAVFHIEGSTYRLQPGDVLLMRPSEAHYIEQDSNVPYERICLNFETSVFSALDPDNTLIRPYYDREAGKRNLYRMGDTVCRSYLDNILKAKDRLTGLANMILLLQQLCTAFDRDNTSGSQPDTLEYRIIRYINRNLEQELSIEKLCEHFYISRAQLCRRFKKITGTSVGKYIGAKRLLAAQNMLRQGKKPTEVFAACGYQDYSTFYRAYVQFFGYSPKELHRLNEPPKDRTEIV